VILRGILIVSIAGPRTLGMKGRVVLAKREAIRKLLDEEATGKDDEGGLRARVLGPMAQKRHGWLRTLFASARQILRRRPGGT